MNPRRRRHLRLRRQARRPIFSVWSDVRSEWRMRRGRGRQMPRVRCTGEVRHLGGNFYFYPTEQVVE